MSRSLPHTSRPSLGGLLIAIDEFEVFMKQCQYDTRAFAVWLQKCSTAKGARLFKEQELRVT